MEQLTAAVIGCGRMGAFTSEAVLRNAPPCWFPLSHAEAILAHPRLRLAALADTDPHNLARAASSYGGATPYADPIELLEVVRPQLATLATRTMGRAALLHTAFGVGTRAIHAEKPLCNSVAELEGLQALFASPELFVTWGAIRRFLPVYKHALALATSGQFGSLKEVRVNFGSAALFWTHPHAFDLLLFAASGRKLEAVQARLENVEFGRTRTEIESDPVVVSASVYFEGGLAGHVTRALGSDFVLTCETAEIIVRADGAKLDIYAAGDGAYPQMQGAPIPASDGPGGTLAALSQLVACLDGDAQSIESNVHLRQDILGAQRIAFATVQSHLQASRLVDPRAIDGALAIVGRTGGRAA